MFAWRQHMSYNKYTSIAARALRQVLTDEERAKAARRGEMGLKYAFWENGKQGEQKWIEKPKEE